MCEEEEEKAHSMASGKFSDEVELLEGGCYLRRPCGYLERFVELSPCAEVCQVNMPHGGRECHEGTVEMELSLQERWRYMAVALSMKATLSRAMKM